MGAFRKINQLIMPGFVAVHPIGCPFYTYCGKRCMLAVGYTCPKIFASVIFWENSSTPVRKRITDKIIYLFINVISQIAQNKTGSEKVVIILYVNHDCRGPAPNR
jgi:hypothetical protein